MSNDHLFSVEEPARAIVMRVRVLRLLVSLLIAVLLAMTPAGVGAQGVACPDVSDPTQSQVIQRTTVSGIAATAGPLPGPDQQLVSLTGILNTVNLEPDGALRLSLLDLADATQSVNADIPPGTDSASWCAMALKLLSHLGVDPGTLQGGPRVVWSSDVSQPATGVTIVGKAVYDAASCDATTYPAACWSIQPVIQLDVLSADDLASFLNGPSPAPPAPPPGATMAVTFVAMQGSDPAVIVDRIAGPGAYFRRAALSGPNPPPMVAQRLLRTYAIPAIPGTEQQLLARAQADPLVESAQLVRWPLVIPM